jgi:uncharacterized protein YoxC
MIVVVIHAAIVVAPLENVSRLLDELTKTRQGLVTDVEETFNRRVCAAPSNSSEAGFGCD